MLNDLSGQKRLHFQAKPQAIGKVPMEILRASDSILDLGCGNGWLTAYIPDKRKYTGLTNSKPEADNLKNWGYKVIICDLLEDKFILGDSKFDCVFASHIIEHFEQKDLIRIMQKIHKALKPGGWVILAAPTDYNPFFWAEWSHVRPYNHGSLPGLISEMGFNNVGWTYPQMDFFSPKYQSLLRFPLTLFKPLLYKEIFAWGQN